MRKNSILLLTKDAMCVDYLPCYGNRYWKGKTPNLDALVEKGTLYTRYYTVAPSSNMSYLAMCTGKFPYELGISNYVHLEKDYEALTLFDRAYEFGYSCHILWDETWMADVAYARCYGKHTVFHPIKDLGKGVGSYFKHEGFLVPDEDEVQRSLQKLREELDQIAASDESIFLWIHLPHDINGRVSFGGDIYVYDEMIGILREYFSDDYIYISADHGNMNGHEGVLGYGFHCRENEIRIPLISPRKGGLAVCDELMCNVDTYDLIFGSEIPVREHVFSDTKYYAQPNRILAIIKGKYKYLYYKDNGTEELFDLFWDPKEQFSLISDMHHDIARNADYPAREHFFYDSWDKLPQVRDDFRKLRASMWRDLSKGQKIYRKCRRFAGKVYRAPKKAMKKVKDVLGGTNERK